MSYTLPPLAYAYDALEPVIDAKTVEIHYSKHHQTYCDNLNKTLAQANYAAPECVCELLKDLSKVPEAIRTAVRNHGGGFMNHNLYWKVLGPSKAKGPNEALMEKITQAFGDFEKFKAEFEAAALGQFGSGWAWLIVKQDGSVAVVKTLNQDSPIMKGVVPANIETNRNSPIMIAAQMATLRIQGLRSGSLS